MNATKLSRRQLLARGGALGALSFLPASLFSTGTLAQEGKVLRYLHHSPVSNLGPLRGGGGGFGLTSLWWASPMYYTADGELHPYVFTNWEHNEAQDVWTFKLDPDAKFSDGSPITVDDVKGSFELIAVPSTKHQRADQVVAGIKGYAAAIAGEATTLEGITAPDPQTIQIELTAPDPVFFMRIANQLAPIVKISQARDANGEQVLEFWHPNNGVAVSGPFVPTAMDLDNGTATFVRNENFFGPQPIIETIDFRVVADPVIATSMLRNGEADIHTELLTTTVVQDLGAAFVEGPVIPNGHHFWFDLTKAPMDDKKVRQALIMSIDRDGMIKAAFPNGPFPRADQILAAVPGVEPDYDPYGYDPEQAKQLLAESSYGSAERLPRLMMVGIGNAANQAAAQYIAEQWRQNLGITAVDIKPQIDSFSGPDQQSIQIFRDDVGTRVPDAAVMLLGAIHSGSGNARSKLGGYKNPAIDQLLEEANALPLEDPQRVAKALEAQRLFMDEWAFIPWYHKVEAKYAMPYVKGNAKNLDWQVGEPWLLDVERS